MTNYRSGWTKAAVTWIVGAAMAAFCAGSVSATGESAEQALETEASKRILNILRAERSAFRALETDNTFARTGRLPATPRAFSTGSINDPNLDGLRNEDELIAAMAAATESMDVEAALHSHEAGVAAISEAPIAHQGSARPARK